MCGRFTLHHPADEVADRFDVDFSLFEATPRYNVAPQQAVTVVTAGENGRTREAMRWGLVPSWAKDDSMASKMINARSETVTEKPSYKNAFSRRRCLIPADGFYEWERLAGNVRQPVHFRLKEGALFAIAGLWEEWQSLDGSPLRTCTVLTTQANALVGRVHDRMPVILHPDDEALWLDPNRRSGSALSDLLSLCVPYSDDAMDAYSVARLVNSPTNDSAELIEPIAD